MALTKKHLMALLSRDFETSLGQSSASLKKQCDKLANYAYIAMKALEDNGIEDFVLLKHDDLRKWWAWQKDRMREHELEVQEKARRAELRKNALARLSDEEKIALGLKK